MFNKSKLIVKYVFYILICSFLLIACNTGQKKEADNTPLVSDTIVQVTPILLLLSSYAEGDNLLKLVSITVDSFAC